MDDDRPRRAVQVAEMYADGLASREELESANSRARAFARHQEKSSQWISAFAAHAAHHAAFLSRVEFPEYEAFACASSASSSAERVVAAAAKGKRDDAEAVQRCAQAEAAERAVQAALLRDIFGNPFRPAPAFDPSWRTNEVATLANHIYEGKSFDRMPGLADLLERASCENRAILDHLREAAQHVRGCWALDLVRGKS
jgi:hypothetical protein